MIPSFAFFVISSCLYSDQFSSFPFCERFLYNSAIYLGIWLALGEPDWILSKSCLEVLVHNSCISVSPPTTNALSFAIIVLFTSEHHAMKDGHSTFLFMIIWLPHAEMSYFKIDVKSTISVYKTCVNPTLNPYTFSGCVWYLYIRIYIHCSLSIFDVQKQVRTW